MAFAVGSLVKARGREWVVLPESADDLLVLRPLGGTEDEIAGIYLPLETVEPALFDLPDPSRVGDFRSCRLLRDAVRLGFRSSAGPFRSFARIAVEPRPYQLVPLLMALKLDPVRLLIADDVGIGKTVEACLVARELLDRGEVQRLAVLCPPHLAEQWQLELREKFHLDCELVLPSTASRLERHCAVGQSLFDVYPYVVVSMDFIKSDRRRAEFQRACPELVLVDEAHTCAFGVVGRAGRHQRHQLIQALASNPERHLILVTATPHSGNEEAFRSLLGFLSPQFAELPTDLTGKENERHRRSVAAHFVQRRRADIRHFLDADTPFPDREEAEESYKLSPAYRALFERVLRYARETVKDQATNQHRQRVRWWAALALLRSLASSPAAAAATLRSRADTADTETAEEADDLGRRLILDIEPDDAADAFDVTPGSDVGDKAADETSNRRRLLEMARAADALQGAGDEKLRKAVKLLKDLLNDGYHPIVFCRFIATAEYVAAALREALPRGVEVAAVTGTLPPAEREERIHQLTERATQEGKKPLLVCTDCLSEGVNLQQHFNAVLHYDLSWNPTRHEQREGRVDRYGQPRRSVRVLTYYGIDNQIDGIVLDVLIRKHKTIRSALGISVPVPVDTNAVVEAIFEGLLLREQSGGTQQLPLFEALIKPDKDKLYTAWDNATERERRSRTVFAQETIKVDEVAQELRAAQAAVGSGVTVAEFMREAVAGLGGAVSANGCVTFNLGGTPRALREAIGNTDFLKARFDLPVDEGILYLHRTHPVVEGVAGYVMNAALDPHGEGVARRCGVIRTAHVTRRTTALLLRFRYHIVTVAHGQERPLLAEDCQLVAFAGSPDHAEWLDPEEAERLLHTAPSGNILPEQASAFVGRVIAGADALRPHLDTFAQRRGEVLLDAHRRVRTGARMKGVSYRVEPQLPADVLGIYVYLPSAAGN